MGGVSLMTAELTATGFQYDRFWMLIDDAGKFISQREMPVLALFKLQLIENGVIVKYETDELFIPFINDTTTNESIWTTIHKDGTWSVIEPEGINHWFSNNLKTPVRLVRQVPLKRRTAKDHPDANIDYSDGSQFLIVGESSLQLLNEKLEEPIKMNRFRPNIVFEGGNSHEEDTWKNIHINSASFQATKTCSRCKITTINQETGDIGKEPLKTLSDYRSVDGKVAFGTYLKQVDSIGQMVHVGDEMNVK